MENIEKNSKKILLLINVNLHLHSDMKREMGSCYVFFKRTIIYL